MRIDWALYLFTLLTAVSALGIEPRRHVERIDSTAQSDVNDLFKRKGGGARGGGGGGSRSGGSSGNRGSSAGSSSGSSGGTRTIPSNARPNSNAGGTSFQGSGPQPRFGGGRYYGGGARTPYTAGKSRSGLAAPFLLGGAALAFWPGLWLTSAYMYNYPHHYRYHNETTDEDEEKPVICACAEDSVCSCGENNSTLKELVGDGSYDGLNKSVINIGEVNGTTYLLVNGTLPKGTTLKDENAEGDDDSAGRSMRDLAQTLGLWPAVAAVAAAVWLV